MGESGTGTITKSIHYAITVATSWTGLLVICGKCRLNGADDQTIFECERNMKKNYMCMEIEVKEKHQIITS